MMLNKILFILISTLLVGTGCNLSTDSSANDSSSSSNNLSFSISSQNVKSISHSQKPPENKLLCLMDNSKSISTYYDQNLEELKINGYSTFTLESINEIETSETRPHEFTRIYKNKQGYIATLMSQSFIRRLEITNKRNQTKSYSFDSGLECNTLPNSKYSTYIVSVDKAFIYKQPYLESKTSSYFIAGDEIKVLSTEKNWIQTSYLKGSKKGWLRLNDLKALKNLDLTDDKIQDRPEEIRADNPISSNRGKYIITKNGIGNIPLGQNFDPNGFEKLESQLEGVDNCFLTTSKKYPKYQHSLYFQFVDNIFVGASISSMGDNKIPFESYNGIKIGDTTETVLKLHDKPPDEIFNNIHSDEPIFIYWTDSSEKIGLRYDILSEKVVSIGIHYSPYIRYFEGCG